MPPKRHASYGTNDIRSYFVLKGSGMGTGKAQQELEPSSEPEIEHSKSSSKGRKDPAGTQADDQPKRMTKSKSSRMIIYDDDDDDAEEEREEKKVGNKTEHVDMPPKDKREIPSKLASGATKSAQSEQTNRAKSEANPVDPGTFFGSKRIQRSDKVLAHHKPAATSPPKREANAIITFDDSDDAMEEAVVEIPEAPSSAIDLDGDVQVVNVQPAVKSSKPTKPAESVAILATLPALDSEMNDTPVAKKAVKLNDAAARTLDAVPLVKDPHKRVLPWSSDAVHAAPHASLATEAPSRPESTTATASHPHPRSHPHHIAHEEVPSPHQDKKDATPEKPAKPSASSLAKTPAAQHKPASPTTAAAKAPAESAGTGDAPLSPKKYKFWQKKSTGPVAPGSKDIPVGAENCLAGLSFVFTGELSSISREDAQDLIKRYGGRVTGAPSGKTSYVVVGDEPGPSKIAKIKELKLKTLDEDGLLDLIRKSKPKSDEEVLKSPKKGDKGKSVVSLPTPPTLASSGFNSSSQGTMRHQQPNAELWTEKYRPRTINELVGNPGLVQKLARWLRGWDEYRRDGFPKDKDEFHVKAVLLSGPPGIGKTTAAHLVAVTEGFEPIEFNASDTRSKKSLDELVSEICTSHTVKEFFTAKTQRKSSDVKSHVVIMDEVDGMSAGDRGGVAELIQILKRSKVPIICICNDRASPKIRSLANYCLDLRFRRPTDTQMEVRLRDIAEREGLLLRPNVVSQLVQSTGSDVRQILNILSTYRLKATSLSYDQSKELTKMSEKDVVVGPFEVTQKLFNQGIYRSASMAEKLEYYFYDFSLVPLMIQENYLKSAPAIAREVGGASPRKMALETLKLLSNAADSISDGDILDRVLRSSNNWGLMPAHALLSTVRPAFFTHGGLTGQVAFSSFLGNNSTQQRRYRLLREIQMHMGLRISGDKKEVRQTYIPSLSLVLSQPIIDSHDDGIRDVISMMDGYYLSKDDWDNVMELDLQGDAKAAKISRNLKTSFTKVYNQGSHPMPFSTTGATSKSGRGGAGAGRAGESGGLDGYEEVDDEDANEAEGNNDESDPTEDVSSFVKKKSAGKGSRAGQSKGKATARTADDVGVGSSRKRAHRD